MKVAVLFARHDSVYKTFPECDVWDAARDALKWPGGLPVVTHPPCRAWGELSHMAKPRLGEKELAPWAVEQVRKYGGVLEHPAKSKLWPALQLPAINVRDDFGGWTLPIWQFWWGHRARKATRLYIVGVEPRDVPTMPMVLGDAEFVVGTSGRRRDGSRGKSRPEISKSEREHTPLEMARWLVDLAQRVRKPEKMPTNGDYA